MPKASKKSDPHKGRKKCGAQRKRGAGICTSWALANGRCKMHGGMTTGAPENNTNAVKHNIFSKLYTDEEKEFLANQTPGDLSFAIEIVKVRLHRVAKILSEIEADPNQDTNEAGMIVSEITDVDSDQFGKTRTVNRRRSDYEAIFDRLVARLGFLEKTNRELKGDTGEEATKAAKVVVDAIKAIRSKRTIADEAKG